MVTTSIGDATDSYETWLRSHVGVVEAHLAKKHKLMAGEPFQFLRATYYRWTQHWPEHCAPLTDAPQVLAVGDLHTENFGTWRDAEGRFVWGVNDLDEAHRLPYTHDLVRLATSAFLGIKCSRLAVTAADACDALLAGYAKGLAAGGRPFVFAERHRWLGDIARKEVKEARAFWTGLDSLPEVRELVPRDARAALESLLPEPRPPYRVVQREAGVGSLGCPRFAALVDWQGGKIAREAKAVPPSAHVWAGYADEPPVADAKELLEGSLGARDPFLRLTKGWRVRRLAPDCCKLDLAALPSGRNEERLLRAMGKETANIHLASAEMIPKVRDHLKSMERKWLLIHARRMADVITDDWKAWRSLVRKRRRELGVDPTS